MRESPSPETPPSKPLPSKPLPSNPLAPEVRTARAKFAEVVLVCRKCARRQGLGKAEARALAKAGYEAGYKAAGRRAGARAAGKTGAKPRIVESGCLGPCPKRMLAVATGASVAAGRVLLVDPRDPTAAFPAFGPDFGPNAKLGARPGDTTATDRGAPA